MKLFDTHAHIGLIHEDPIEQLLVCQEAKKEGIEYLVSICNSLIDFDTVHANLKNASNVYHAVGISPSEVDHPGKDWEHRIQDILADERVVAMGEMGLDYYHKFGNKNAQIELFIQQLEMAEQLDYPVIIHNREAGKDVLDILKERLPAQGGVLHCYSEDWAYAKEALDLNLYISFAGNVTYRNARNLHETAKKMPLDRLLIESESPFMVPAEYRGKRNKPAYLKSTLNFIADLRDEDFEEVEETLLNNSKKIFRLN